MDSKQATGRHRRHISTSERSQAVLRALHGEDIETISSQLGVTSGRLERWKAAFVEAGTQALARTHHRPWLQRIRRATKPMFVWGGLILVMAIVIMALVRAFAPQE